MCVYIYIYIYTYRPGLKTIGDPAGGPIPHRSGLRSCLWGNHNNNNNNTNNKYHFIELLLLLIINLM